MSAYAQLKRSRQKFVDAYVATGIGSDAAREAGYSKHRRPDNAASKLLQMPLVKEAVAERTQEAIAKAGVRSVRVLEELAAVALFNPQRLYSAEGKLRQLTELEPEVAAGLTGMEVEELADGKTRVKKYRFGGKNDALKTLCGYLKLIVERRELTAKDGEPLIPAETRSDLEVARRIAFLMDAGLRSNPLVTAPPARTPLTLDAADEGGPL